MDKQTCSHKGKGRWIAARLGRGIVIGLAFVLGFGILVRLLWNWLMPEVFGLREVTYLQAVGMVVLSRILLGLGGRGMRHGFHHGHGSWAGIGPCSHGAGINGHIEDWRHYEAWWEAEGREAFRKYSESKSNESKTQNEA